MPRAKSTNRIEITLHSVELLSKGLKEKPDPEVDPDSLSYEVTTVEKANFEEKLIYIGVQVNINSGEQEESLCYFNVACIFELPDFDKYIKKKGGKFSLPDELASFLNEVSISTTRGIMYSELRGTYLDNFLLPVIYQQDLQSVE